MSVNHSAYDNIDLLQPGTIVAALCLTPGLGKFHWIIYLITDSRGSGGYKFHATNQMGAVPWQYEVVRWDGVASARCVTLTPIGRIHDWDLKPVETCVADLDAILREVPLEVPAIDRHKFDSFTCRTWFRAAIRELNKRGKYVQCPNVDAFEERLTRIATAIELINRQYGRSSTQIMKAIREATPWP